MTDNPNYVPVQWADEVIVAGSVKTPGDIEIWSGEGRITIPESTLNSAGDVVRVGDRVMHVADSALPQMRRDVGIVEALEPVDIAGTRVENGARVRWPSTNPDNDDIVSGHHVDNLTVLL